MAFSFDIQVIKGDGIYSREFVASGDDQVLNLNNYGLSGYVKFRHGSTNILLDLEPEKKPGSEADGVFSINLDSNELTIPFGGFFYNLDAYSGNATFSLYRGTCRQS